MQVPRGLTSTRDDKTKCPTQAKQFEWGTGIVVLTTNPDPNCDQA